MMRSPLPGGLTPKVKQGVSVVIEQILAETEHCGVELELLARISFIRDDQWELLVALSGFLPAFRRVAASSPSGPPS